VISSGNRNSPFLFCSGNLEPYFADAQQDFTRVWKAAVPKSELSVTWQFHTDSLTVLVKHDTPLYYGGERLETVPS
jgi:hypothetical protein